LAPEAAATRVRKYASPFPPRNRRWIYCPDTLGTYSQRTAHYGRYAAHVSAIGVATPGVTAVFFSSYDFLEQVASQLPESERVLLVREARKDAGNPGAPGGLDDYRRQLKQLVLAQRRAYLFAVYQGKIAEGADFPDNLIRSIVCVSLPLERPLLFHERLRRRYELALAPVAARLGDDVGAKAREYALERLSLSLVLQACGRGLRRPEDRCALVLLDRRYGEGSSGLDWRRFLDPAPYNTPRPDQSVMTFHAPDPAPAVGDWDPVILAACGRRRPQ
jgi:Rad3-related DNA helicase